MKVFSKPTIRNDMRKALLVEALATVPLFVHSAPKSEPIQKSKIEEVSKEDAEKAARNAFLLSFALTSFMGGGFFGVYYSNNLSRANGDGKKLTDAKSAKVMGEASAFLAGCLLCKSQVDNITPSLFILSGWTTMLVWDCTFLFPTLNEIKENQKN